MIKNLFLLSTVLFFIGCSSSVPFNYSKKTDELKLKISEQNFYTQKLEKPQYTYTFDSCTNDSYFLNSKNFFVEYISLDMNCNWNGEATGYFHRELKYELKLDSMKTLEQIDIKNYTFSTFKIDEKYILNTISVYTTFTDVFIIDYNGSLYTNLLKQLKPEYKNKYQDLPRFKTEYTYSLVKNNFFQNYFNKESSNTRDN